MEQVQSTMNENPSQSQKLKLVYDEHLHLSNDEFQTILRKCNTPVHESKIDRLKNVPEYPKPYVFVKLSSESYVDKLRNESDETYEKRISLPTGWKVLTTACNNSLLNGYFGVAIYNENNRQIIIAHRGTNPRNIGSIRSDLQGVFENEYVPQMNSACTFAHLVFDAIQELPCNWTLFFTGHSLGAWLAQLTTFTVKYLKLQDKYFVKNLYVYQRQLHTEVFDSPGSKDMLLKLTADYGIEYENENDLFKTLDMTTYLSSPNVVNCCNHHIGNLYRIYPKITNDEYVKYTLSSHSIEGILEAFDPETGQVHRDPSKGYLKMKLVLYWPKLEVKISLWQLLEFGNSDEPVLGLEYVDFFKWANTMNDFDPEPDVVIPNPHSKCNFEIVYETKPFREYECATTVFTQSELEFLFAIKEIDKNGSPIFENAEDTTFVFEELRKITIQDSTLFSFEDNLRYFIPFVKTLFEIMHDMSDLKLGQNGFTMVSKNDIIEQQGKEHEHEIIATKEDSGWFDMFKSCVIS